jgi:hypothetical protein
MVQTSWFDSVLGHWNGLVYPTVLRSLLKHRYPQVSFWSDRWISLTGHGSVLIREHYPGRVNLVCSDWKWGYSNASAGCYFIVTGCWTALTGRFRFSISFISFWYIQSRTASTFSENPYNFLRTGGNHDSKLSIGVFDQRECQRYATALQWFTFQCIWSFHETLGGSCVARWNASLSAIPVASLFGPRHCDFCFETSLNGPVNVTICSFCAFLINYETTDFSMVYWDSFQAGSLLAMSIL